MARHDTDPKTGNERYYQEVRSRGAVGFICAAAGLFGLMALLGFFSRLPHVGGDEYFLLVLGSFCVWFAWRFWLFTTRPYLTLTPSKLAVSKLFRTRSWKFDDITALASFPTIIQATVNGRKGPPVPVHYLGIATRNGKFSRVVLPDHRGNERLLHSLTENSLVAVTDLAGTEMTLDEWEKSALHLR